MIKNNEEIIDFVWPILKMPELMIDYCGMLEHSHDSKVPNFVKKCI